MDKEVLIAIREREDDFTRRVESILRNRVPRIPVNHIILPDIATNEAEARTRISRRRYDLVIAHVHLAADERGALVEEDRRGLELLASSIVQGRGTSSILIAPLAMISCGRGSRESVAASWFPLGNISKTN